MENKNRILIVDDNVTNVAVLETILEDKFEYKSVENGEEALKVVHEFQPSVILLDIMMPGIDGYEVCRRIRSDEKLRYIKIVLVSAKAMIEERLKGYEVGADDYVTKPFDEDELLAKVNVFVKLKYVEEIDQFKNEVLNMFTQGKNTPLHSIYGFATLLQKSDQISEGDRVYVDEIVDRCKKVMDFSRKTMLLCHLRGNAGINKTENEITQIIQDITQEAQKHLLNTHISLKTESKIQGKVLFDRDLLAKALFYLVEISLKQSPDNGTIKIKAEQNNGTCVIQVHDQAFDVPPENLNIPDDIFGSMELIKNNKIEGLGLIIARQIAQLHNGTLSASSNKDGTTFELSLPMK